MKLKLLIAAALLCLALPAAADFQTVSRAYELKLSNLTIPTSQNGRVLFKKCDQCEMAAARLTPNTKFLVNGRSVRFDKFRSVANEISDDVTVPVTVLEHLDSGNVVRVSLTLRNRGNRNH